ncbi:MAG TPA: divergent polysaccharide deacetylase family protein [Candidatus Eremiobacteraceae bacterium]|nr:divergent polysaccharide deacetylase family protein [Candidatus Eremiobacteraceae bacterium]
MLVGLIVAASWWGIVALKRQIAGYYGGGSHAHQAKQRTSQGTRPLKPGPQVAQSAPPALRPAVSGTGPLAPPHPPRVAIIIDDCGNNLPKDEQFLPFSVPLTLAILPLTQHGREFAQEAQAAGKPIMLHLPMQPLSSDYNPGPGAITTSMTDQQIMTQVELDLESLPPVPGGNNHMGSRGTSDPRVMHDVLAVFKSKGLFFIDSETTNASLGAQMAREAGVQTAARDVFLDNDVNEKAIEAQLLATEKVALERGQAIAIGHPFPETAQALSVMIPQMQAAGIEFVAAETLVK